MGMVTKRVNGIDDAGTESLVSRGDMEKRITQLDKEIAQYEAQMVILEKKLTGAKKGMARRQIRVMEINYALRVLANLDDA